VRDSIFLCGWQESWLIMISVDMGFQHLEKSSYFYPVIL
jgi:hypothetical protein